MITARKRQHRLTNDDLVMREVKLWIKEHPTPDGRLDVDAMTRSFIENDTIPDPRVSRFRRTKRSICGAMTRYHVHDEELGSVRTIYPVRTKDVQGQTMWEWAYGPLVLPDHVAKSLRQRYNSVESRIHCLENDRRYYNKTNKHGAELPTLDYDFNRLMQETRLAEMHGGEYPDQKPED